VVRDRIVVRAMKTVAVLMALYHLAFVSKLFTRLGFYSLQISIHTRVSLTFMLIFVFLAFPARKGTARRGLPWYDVLFIFMGIAGAGYYFFFHDLAVQHYTMAITTSYELVLMIALLITLLEAGRRVIGLPMPIIVTFFLAYAFFSESFPGFLQATSPSFNLIVQTIYLSPQGIFGMPMQVASTILMMFIIFSAILTHTGAGRFFINLSLSLFGFTRGGPAKAAIIGSAAMATISGTTSGNVAATGSVTIPLMKGTGYRPHFAGAVEAVASKGGQVTPPVMGVVAFIMAEFLGITYLEVCIAAAVPAILYFLSVFTQVDLEAARLGLRGLSRGELPPFRKTMTEGWHYLLPIVMLVTLIVILKYSVALAGFYAVVFLFLVSMVKRESRLSLTKLVMACSDFARLVVIAGVACALAGPILASLDVTGLGVKIATELVLFAGGNKFLLLGLAAVACFIFGMGMTSIGVYLVLVALIAPALMQTGVDPIAAHLFVIYWGNVSLITPPVAIGAYVAAGIAGADPMKTGWQACRLGIVSFVVPFIFAYNPALLLIGSPGEIALAVTTAIIGILSLAAGVEGWTLSAANWLERPLLIIGGIVLLIPGSSTDLFGFGMIGLAMFSTLRRSQRSRRR